ncbi:pyridoxamine 5'-phosphate oxidase family protein [Pseudonocardia sp.]|uniref:pyridoxamine 5'-phosphate oxidase family protein n=1 Tax=Pseudonocardia sp. TaxID=60912 RepID=UPI003D12912B
MSIPVDLTELVRVLERFDYAYLLTTDAQCHPHVVAVSPVAGPEHLTIDEVGRKTWANATERPHVTLVWPPADRSDHSLIVDATCTPEGSAGLRVVPTRAVLHRPAPPTPTAEGCGSDCVEVLARRSDG